MKEQDMLVQRTTTQQSAAGSLLAALAKGERAEGGASFVQQFNQTLSAVNARDAQRREQPIAGDEGGRRLKVREPRRTEREEAPVKADERSHETTNQPAAAAEQRSTSASHERRDAEADVEQLQQERVEAKASAKSGEPVRNSQAEQEPDGAAVQSEMSAEGNAAAGEAETEDLMSDGLVSAVKGQAAAAATVATAAVSNAAQPGGEAVTAAKKDVATAAALNNTTAVEAYQTDDLNAAEVTKGAAQTQAAATQAGAEVQAMNSPRLVRSSSRRQATKAAADQEQVTAVAKPSEPAPGTKDQNAHQTNFNQAMRNLGLQGQQVRADVVSVQVNYAAPNAVADDAQSSQGLKAVDTLQAATQKAGAVAGKDLPQAESGSVQNEQIERITRTIRASISRGGSRVQLQLDPAELGRMRVQLQIRGTELTARFETTTEPAKMWLQSQMHQLRDSLASQGMRLVDATVENHGPDAEVFREQAGQQAGNFGDTQPGQQEQQQSGSHRSGGAAEDGDGDPVFWKAPAESDERLNVVV